MIGAIAGSAARAGGGLVAGLAALLAAAVAAEPTSTDAPGRIVLAQYADDARDRSGGSVYRGYGNRVFARGGALFAGHSNDGDFDAFGLSASAGYRRRFAQQGRFSWWFEPSIAYVRESEEIDVVGFPVENTTWALAGLLSLRGQWDFDFLTPFWSVGVGPAYIETVVDDDFRKLKNGVMAVGYSGVAGFEKSITETLSLEAAYRYLGATREEVLGLHSAEIGVNYRF